MLRNNKTKSLWVKHLELFEQIAPAAKLEPRDVQTTKHCHLQVALGMG